MRKQVIPVLLVIALIAAVWVLRPITSAIAAAMETKVVNTVRVKESGALVKKIFDTQMGPESRHGADANLKGYKTVRVAVYQTTADGSSSGSPIETNYVCGGAAANKFGVDVQFGGGREGGVTAGNNILEVDEPPNMTNRTHIYVGEFPVLRPQFGVDLCNHSNEPVNVEVFIYAFRN